MHFEPIRSYPLGQLYVTSAFTLIVFPPEKLHFVPLNVPPFGQLYVTFGSDVTVQV